VPAAREPGVTFTTRLAGVVELALVTVSHELLGTDVEKVSA
jgi:hypothetical protein